MAGQDRGTDTRLLEIIDRAVRQETRRYLAALDRLFVDAGGAREGVSQRVREVGPTVAGKQLAAAPEEFGGVRSDLQKQVAESLATEAGRAASAAYQLQASRGNPMLASRRLTERVQVGFTELYSDPSAAYKACTEHIRLHGAASAAEQLRRDPTTYGDMVAGGARHADALAVRVEDGDEARRIAAAFERRYHETMSERVARLPTTTDELRDREGGRLPQSLEIKLGAFSADFRGKLAEAYPEPAAAETAFHDLIAREGTAAAAAAVRRDPRILGDLHSRPDAADIAASGAKRGARAYELNAIRNPAQAAEVLQRETERSFARQCENPGEALRRIREAIHERGIERVADEIARGPQEYFQAREGESLNGPALAGEVRAMAAHDEIGARYLATAEGRSGAAPELPSDTPLHDAVADFARAETGEARKQELHKAINAATKTLKDLEAAKKWKGIHERQTEAAFKEVFADPVAAKKEFDRIAEGKGTDAALTMLERRPQKLGALRTTRRTWRRASTSDARAAIPDAIRYAEAMQKRKDYLREVEWTDEIGGTHRGEDAVRTATTKQIGDHAVELGDADRALRALGGRERALDRAVDVMTQLGERLDGALQRLASENAHLKGAADAAHASMKQRSPRGTGITMFGINQAAGTVRSLAEGPSPG